MGIKNFLKNKIKIISATVFVFLFLFTYQYTEAASLKMSASLQSMNVGGTNTIFVFVDSQGMAINNAEGTISFPAEFFDVTSVSKDSSVFNLWVEEPSFSNLTGLISFNGGVPTPGFSGAQGRVLSFIVRAKKAGQANVSFLSASVRANDGLGTDVLTGKTGTGITITEKQKTLEVDKPVQQPTLQDVTSSGIKISSTTHPNQEKFYNGSDLKMQWNIPVGADAVQTGISKNFSELPKVIYSPAVSEKIMKDLGDGVWYFKVRARKNGVWGTPAVYTARIDRTAPVKGQHSFNYDNELKTLNISVDSNDEGSGIESYKILINNDHIKTVSATDFVNGKYSIEFDAFGDNAVKIIVSDRAGNSTDFEGSFYAKGDSVPKLDQIPQTVFAGEQLLIRGKTQSPNMDVVVNIKHEKGDVTSIKTMSDDNRAFITLTPELKMGEYEIWAETGTGAELAQSRHEYTKVTSYLTIKIGKYSLNDFMAVIIVLLLSLLPFALALVFRRKRIGLRYSKRLGIPAMTKEDKLKTLTFFKKHLHGYLEHLQIIRNERILTKEERVLKQDIESDLDEIDKELGEMK